MGAGLLVWVIMGSSHAEINSPRGEHSVAPRADLLELRNAAAMPTAPAGMTVSALTGLPLRFEENLGQTDPSVKFVCRAPNYTAFIAPSETVFVVASGAGGAPLPPGPGLPNPQQPASTSVTAAAVRLRLAGGAVSPVVSGSGKLIAPSNFLLGNTSSQWLSGVPQFSRVDFLQVYPGIDMSYYGDQNQLKSQFVVHTGTSPGNIKLSFEGADAISLDTQGNLVLSTSAGNILFKAPRSYQMVQGSQQPVGSRYVIGSDNGVSFQVNAFDPSIDLIIDPAVSYVVVIGGATGTQTAANGVAVDSAGNAYFAGYTYAPDFPVTAGAFQATATSFFKGFVAKVNPTGTALLYSTYLGGKTPAPNAPSGATDTILGITVNAQGNVFVTGDTTSTDFPTLNAAQPTNNGTTSAFLTELSPDGGSMVFSTFLGGSGHAFGTKVALDPSGNVYVAGETLSANFPTLNAYQTGPVSIGAFVTKYSPSGAVVYSTLIGNYSAATSLAVDGAGSAYITGWFLTAPGAFYPTTPGAFQTVAPVGPSPTGSNSAIFVTKLSPAGNSLVYSTFLGGGSDWTKGNDIALDSTGAVYVTGSIDSPTFPTTPGAFQPQLSPPSTPDPTGSTSADAFLTKLSPDGSSLIFSTFLGGNQFDQGLGVSVDPSGDSWIAGTSNSPDFPILNPLPPGTTGAPVGFVSKFSPTGSLLFSSSLLAGEAFPQSVRTDSSGNAYVVGLTGATSLATLSLAPQGAFLVKLSPSVSASEIAVITDSNGLAVSPPVLLPTTPGLCAVGVSVPGSTVPPVTFTVTALDPAVVTSIAAPVISSPSSGVYLTTATPLISGTSSGPGLTLTLLSGGVPFGTTTTGTGGAWSLTPSLSLGMGAQILTAYLSDGAGNTSPVSGPVAVTINTQPPVLTTTFPVNETTTNLKPTLSARWSDAVSGVIPTSALITLDGINVTSSAITTLGGFTLTPTVPLTFGQHFVSIQVTDGAGLVGVLSYSFTVQPTPLEAPPQIDITPPTITFNAPIPGSFLNASPFAVDILLSDGGSGVNLASLSVSLNGVPLSGAVQTQVLVADNLGVPSTVRIVGAVPGVDGPNTLSVQVSDRAGNPASAASTFNLVVALQQGAIALSMVSGSGQSGLAGRGAPNDLIVQATDSVSGTPLSGVVLNYDSASNTGTFGKSQAFQLVTDDSGKAGIRYVFSSVPGQNIVNIGVAGSADITPVQFQLTGQLPQLVDATNPSPCNVPNSTFDYPGSALSTLFIAQALRPDGSPLIGELVRPFIANFNGAPPTTVLGKFMPAQALTDSAGQARFAFVIDKNAPPGSLDLQFGLPDFRDSNENEVNFHVAGGIKVDQPRDPEIISGQGQIATTSALLFNPLRAQTHPGGFVQFKVIEGTGTFQATPNSDVRDISFDGCGKPVWLLATGSDGVAEIQFQRSTDVVLIGIGPGSDVYAVGPEEVTFVSQNSAGEYIDLPNIFSIPVSQATSDFAYQIKAKVAKGASVTGQLQSLNSFGETVNSIQNAIAPTIIGSFNFQLSSTDSTDEYDAYVTQEQLISTSDVTPASGTATGGGGNGFVLFEITPFGGEMATVKVANQDTGIARIRQSDARGREAFAGRRPLFFYKTDPVSNNPTVVILKFPVADVQKLDSVVWTLGGDDSPGTKTLTGPMANEIYVSYVTGASQIGAQGSFANPVLIQVAENNGNRRKDIPITALITLKQALGQAQPKTITAKATLRIALNNIRIGTQVPAATQVGLNTVENWIASPPANQLGKPFVFAPQAQLPARSAAKIAQLVDDKGNPVNLDTTRPTYTANGPTGESYADPTNFFIFGSVIGNGAYIADQEVLNAIVDHEKAHLYDFSSAKDGLVSVFSEVVNVLNQQNNGNVALTIPYINVYQHSYLLLNDLKDNRFSYKFLNDDSPRIKGFSDGYEGYFVQAFNGIVTTALNGRRAQVLTPTKDQVPLNAVPIGTGQTLQDLKKQLTTTYDLATIGEVGGFPELLSVDEFMPAVQLIRPK